MLTARVRFNRRLKDLLGRAAGIGGVYTRRFRRHMTIVAFHRVTDELPEDGLTCSSAGFEAFCRFFARHFRVLPLSEQLARGRDLGGTLSITFDDGYRDNVEVAAPILSRLGLPATFFVTTGFIGSQVVPPWDRQLPRQPGWMTWDQVRSLKAMGFEIGSHTDTHLDLAKVDAAVARTDLAASHQKLTQALGAAPRLFAYPFGGAQHITPAARELVRGAGFACCASCHGGVNPSAPDPFDLRRIGIAEWFNSPNQFGFELASGRA
ncbi:MAG TPA: polysaccharide deacetylase family protein [Steroidobacteraceae bacterium]|nr:polysaccharide deacetylase family protein [Steroidobacteraceae bacterium]